MCRIKRNRITRPLMWKPNSQNLTQYFFNPNVEGSEPNLRSKKKGKTSSTELDSPTPLKTGYKVIDPIAVLKAAVHTVRHHKLGWLRDDLLLDGTLDGSKEALHQKIFADYQAQQIHIHKSNARNIGTRLQPATRFTWTE